MIWNQWTTLLVLVNEYKWGYAASFWVVLMFRPDQLKRNERERSRMRTKIGGYRIDCHMVAELRMLRRPNARNNTSGEAFINASTTPFCKPEGAMAGARPMKTLTFAFNFGCIEREANA